MKENLQFRVLGERRLALASRDIPDLDALIQRTAGYEIGFCWRKCDAPHPVIVMSQDTNQQIHSEETRGGKAYSFEWPMSVETHAPVDASQLLTVRSLLPLATSLPSVEKATDQTLCCEMSQHMQRHKQVERKLKKIVF